MTKTCLYRHFDANGTLLYVGVSLSAVYRFSQHREHSHWHDNIRTMTVEWFRTRDDALKAETDAIQRENPLHNIKKRRVIVFSERKLKCVADSIREVNEGIPTDIGGIMLFKVNEAAELLGITKDDVLQMHKDKQIAFVYIGKTPRVPAREINRVSMGYDISYSYSHQRNRSLA